jgi:hypothetical protein
LVREIETVRLVLEEQAPHQCTMYLWLFHALLWTVSQFWLNYTGCLHYFGIASPYSRVCLLSKRNVFYCFCYVLPYYFFNTRRTCFFLLDLAMYVKVYVPKTASYALTWICLQIWSAKVTASRWKKFGIGSIEVSRTMLLLTVSYLIRSGCLCLDRAVNVFNVSHNCLLHIFLSKTECLYQIHFSQFIFSIE